MQYHIAITGSNHNYKYNGKYQQVMPTWPDISTYLKMHSSCKEQDSTTLPDDFFKLIWCFLNTFMLTHVAYTSQNNAFFAN